jgi:hypothetical protein
MQSTGQTSTHDLSLTPIQASVITYGILEGKENVWLRLNYMEHAEEREAGKAFRCVLSAYFDCCGYFVLGLALGVRRQHVAFAGACRNSSSTGENTTSHPDQSSRSPRPSAIAST